MDPSSSSQFVSSRNIGVYDPIHQFTIWEEHFKSNGDSSVYEPEMKLNNQVRVQVYQIYTCLLHIYAIMTIFLLLFIFFYAAKYL